MWLIAPVFVAGLLILINFLSYLSVSKIGTDAVSWFLPAKSILNGTGLPYLDYWDTKPTGLILFSALWMFIFGDTINSFRSLHLLMTTVVLFGMMRFYSKLFSKIIFNIVYIFSAIIFMSSLIQTQPLLIELFGLFFTTLAINILISEKIRIETKSFLVSFFFILGGQMKESYAILSISALPFALHVLIYKKEYFKKVIYWAFLGALLCLSILIMFLFLTKTMTSYLEVFRFIMNYNSPSKFYQSFEIPKSTFIYLQYTVQSFFLIFLTFFIYIKTKIGQFSFKKAIVNKKLKFDISLSFPEINNIHIIAIFYVIGACIGFYMQNKFGSHYNAQMVFPIMILISLPIYLLSESILFGTKIFKKNIFIRRIFTIVTILFITVLSFPKKAYFVGYNFKELNYEYTMFRLNTGNNPDMTVENEIINKTKPSDCIIHVYGWGVGTTYFYTDRKPCSRFFLVNLLPENFYEQYSNDLVKNPPAAIVYSLAGADIDNVKFENKVFNYSRVIKSCYVQDSLIPSLYLPKIDPDKLKDCIVKNR